MFVLTVENNTFCEKCDKMNNNNRTQSKGRRPAKHNGAILDFVMENEKTKTI